MADLRQDILEIVATVTEKGQTEILPDAHLVKDIGADSMNALEILAAIEKRYRIVIPEDKLPEMTTLNKIIGLVEQSMKRKKK